MNRSQRSGEPREQHRAPPGATLGELAVRLRQLQTLAGEIATWAEAMAATTTQQPPASEQTVIDKRSASQLGLSPRGFLRLAQEGAFPSFTVDGRGRVCAYVADVRVFLESRRLTPRKGPAKAEPSDVDELISRQLEQGRLRLVAGGKASPKSSR